MPSPPPRSKSGQVLPPSSTRSKFYVADAAFALRDEQIEATVEYYNADMKTNKELDAITEAVVAELRAMQREGAQSVDQEQIEIDLIQALRGHLEKLFSPQRSGFVARRIHHVQKRITQLFFNSELYARLAENGGEIPAASWDSQVLYLALRRASDVILAEIEAIPVTDFEVRDAAIERLSTYERQLCADFLQRTTPELERLLKIYREVLTDFFYKNFPANLGEFCWEVIRESRVAEGHRMGYKITRDKFDSFRRSYDRRFLQHLVFHVQDPIAARAQESAEFRDATAAFVSDPQIHMEICSAINDAVFDYLHGEGFLDLPTDWRRLLTRT